jgi:hypothetical protein
MRAPFSLGPGGSSVPGVHHTRQIPRRPRRLGPRSIGRNHGCTRSLYKKVFECRTPSLSSLGHEGSSTRTRIVGMITIVVERSPPPPIRVEVPFYRLGPPRTRTFSTRAGRLGRRVSHPRELTVRILHRPTLGDWTKRRLPKDFVPRPDSRSMQAHLGNNPHKRSMGTK